MYVCVCVCVCQITIQHTDGFVQACEYVLKEGRVVFVCV